MLASINKRISNKLLAGVALAGMMVASLSVKTACLFFLNQPKVPEQLRK
ncbi:MAG: cyclic lactone autoinducer peptide [Vallitalea sp.]|jgi:cyclic lactone autoinducer peptide|nr:cyclic lactone autoinducer peptide [Vallitalea sp.]